MRVDGSPHDSSLPMPSWLSEDWSGVGVGARRVTSFQPCSTPQLGAGREQTQQQVPRQPTIWQQMKAGEGREGFLATVWVNRGRWTGLWKRHPPHVMSRWAQGEVAATAGNNKVKIMGGRKKGGTEATVAKEVPSSRCVPVSMG